MPLAREPHRPPRPLQRAAFAGDPERTRKGARRSPGSRRRTTWSPSSTPASTSRPSARRWSDEAAPSEGSPSGPSATSSSFSSTTRRSSAGSATCSRSIREEAYYFAPQRQTKIMNEGWAIVLALEADDREVLDASRDHRLRRTTPRACWRRAKGQLNPYKLGRRALPEHRGALGPRPVRQGVGGLRRPRRQEELGSSARPRQGEDLRRCARSTTTSPSSTSS